MKGHSAPSCCYPHIAICITTSHETDRRESPIEPPAPVLRSPLRIAFHRFLSQERSMGAVCPVRQVPGAIRFSTIPPYSSSLNQTRCGFTQDSEGTRSTAASCRRFLVSRNLTLPAGRVSSRRFSFGASHIGVCRQADNCKHKAALCCAC